MIIQRIRVYGPVGEFGEEEGYAVGDGLRQGKITAIIQRDDSPAPYCVQSYIEVWCGTVLHAEFPKANLAAIYYRPDSEGDE